MELIIRQMPPEPVKESGNFEERTSWAGRPFIMQKEDSVL